MLTKIFLAAWYIHYFTLFRIKVTIQVRLLLNFSCFRLIQTTQIWNCTLLHTYARVRFNRGRQSWNARILWRLRACYYLCAACNCTSCKCANAPPSATHANRIHGTVLCARARAREWSICSITFIIGVIMSSARCIRVGCKSARMAEAASGM